MNRSGGNKQYQLRRKHETSLSVVFLASRSSISFLRLLNSSAKAKYAARTLSRSALISATGCAPVLSAASSASKVRATGAICSGQPTNICLPVAQRIVAWGVATHFHESLQRRGNHSFDRV